MRFSALALALVVLVPAEASAQSGPTPLAIELDVLPGIEGVGLGLLGALDVGMLIADGATAASEGRRRRAVLDTEMALGVLDLLGAVPAWWWWTQERIATRQGMALAAPTMMTISGALLVGAAVSGYLDASTRVSIAPSAGGVMTTVSVRF